MMINKPIKLTSNVKILFIAVATAVFLSACSSGSKSSNSQNDSSSGPKPGSVNQKVGEMIREIADNNIIPAANRFQQQSENLAQLADTFCASVQANNLNQLQDSWKQLSTQWHHLLLYNFGPLKGTDPIFTTVGFIDSFREGRGRDSTSTIRSDIAADLASNKTLNQAYFELKEPRKVGLLAIEVLVFENASASKNSLDIISEYNSQPRKCEILKQQSRLLLKRATSIKADWASQRTAYLNNQLQGGGSLKLLLASGWEYFDHLKKRDAVNKTAKIADYGWQNISAAIDELERFMEGVDASQVSVFDVMNSAGSTNAVATIKKNISDAKAAIQSKNDAFLNVTLGKIDGNFKETIPLALDVDLGLNFTDGD